MKKEIRFYRTPDGKEPFTYWFETLKDKTIRAQLKNRLERVAVGNYGDCKALGDGIFELRIHYGPGYRVYFSEKGNYFILFLAGGTKSNQQKDIKKAKAYWADFQERTNE